MTSPANPQSIGRYGRSSDYVSTLAVSGTNALWGGFLDFWGFHVLNVADPISPWRAGGINEVTLGAQTRSIAASGNYAYVAASSFTDLPPRPGLYVFDLTKSSALTPLSRYVTKSNVVAIAVSGEYAYVIDAGEGFVVVNISDPAVPRREGAVATNMYTGDSIGIAVAGGYAYLAQRSLVIIDITQPTAPRLVSEFTWGGYSRSIAVSGSHAYIADSRFGLKIVDVSNPAAPKEVATFAMPIDDSLAVSVLEPYAYVAGSGGVHVIDVSSPAHPRRVGGNNAFTVDDVRVANGHVFLATQYDGLVILDLYETPFRFQEILVGSQGIQLKLTGLYGTAARVQRSADLKAWSDWRSVTFPTRPVELSDPGEAGCPQQFYRMVTP